VAIALKYRTPVMLLSDGVIANGSEPWRVPQVADLPELAVEFATEPNALDGSGVHWPYVRDPETLARGWAVPGTAGLQHRIGGLEKSNNDGNISYDARNHDTMVRLRKAKIDGIEVPDVVIEDPSAEADVLVLGWGSTYGPIAAGARRVRATGKRVATAHLRHLNPFPANLGEVLARYDRIIVPEMNLGQLAQLIRARYLLDTISFTKVAGTPYKAEQIEAFILQHLEEVAPA
jgi:2-oxoglutarate ferredoxin oxidoreductase subunit alpha